MRYLLIALLSTFSTLLALLPAAAACPYNYGIETNYDYTRTYYDGEGRLNYTFNPPLNDSPQGTNCFRSQENVGGGSNYRYYYDTDTTYTPAYVNMGYTVSNDRVYYTRTFVPQATLIPKPAADSEYVRTNAANSSYKKTYVATSYATTLEPQAMVGGGNTNSAYTRYTASTGYKREPVYKYSRTYVVQ